MRNGKILIYIAGPYSNDDPVVNTRAAMEMWARLWARGFYPICPHWTMFQHFLTPLPYEAWLDYDRVMLSLCDGLIRIPGHSAGADGEVAQATHEGIPVFFNVDALFEFFKNVVPA
jgi:hypothetical protein